MSRYWDGDESWDSNWALDMGRWERNSRVVLTSKRGQLWLRELEAALLALPEKRLCQDLATLGEVINDEGELEVMPMVCAVGALALHKGIDYWSLEPEGGREDTLDIARHLGMATTMAALVGEANDHMPWDYAGHNALRENESDRYERMLAWVRDKIHA